jgi:hypothetical protein
VEAAATPRLPLAGVTTLAEVRRITGDRRLV